MPDNNCRCFRQLHWVHCMPCLGWQWIEILRQQKIPSTVLRLRALPLQPRRRKVRDGTLCRECTGMLCLRVQTSGCAWGYRCSSFTNGRHPLDTWHNHCDGPACRDAQYWYCRSSILGTVIVTDLHVVTFKKKCVSGVYWCPYIVLYDWCLLILWRIFKCIQYYLTSGLRGRCICLREWGDVISLQRWFYCTLSRRLCTCVHM